MTLQRGVRHRAQVLAYGRPPRKAAAQRGRQAVQAHRLRHALAGRPVRHGAPRAVQDQHGEHQTGGHARPSLPEHGVRGGAAGAAHERKRALAGHSLGHAAGVLPVAPPRLLLLQPVRVEVGLDLHEYLRMPVRKLHGLDEQHARVAVAVRLEKVDIPQNRVIFHGVLWVGFVTFFQQVVIKYIKRTLSSRAHVRKHYIIEI